MSWSPLKVEGGAFVRKEDCVINFTVPNFLFFLYDIFLVKKERNEWAFINIQDFH